MLNQQIKNTTKYRLDKGKSVLTEDFAQIYIEQNNVILKIDFVNDIPEHFGKNKMHKY